MLSDITAFRLPRIGQIPDVGLYLDQTVKYINRYLAMIGCMELTSSMVSNYVKKGYIANPVHKQYGTEQIGRLMVIALCKPVMSMENIARLMELQQESVSFEKAYDAFCDSLESALCRVFGQETAEQPALPDIPAARIMNSAVTAIANVIYLSSMFDQLEPQSPQCRF